MVRSAVADEYLLDYLKTLGKANSFSIGLILGQYSFGKDYVIHFAKTPAVPSENDQASSSKVVADINDINASWLADHARHATRMLPGGMHVIGIFIISQDDVLTKFSPKIMAILKQIHKQLGSTLYLYGNISNEYLVLNYNNETQNCSCKSFDVVTASVKNAEFKFLPKAVKWSQIECKYEMDQIYHVKGTDANWSLQKHMDVILDNINNNLKNAIFMYDGEIKEADESLDNVGKKNKKVLRTTKPMNVEQVDFKALHVDILQSSNTSGARNGSNAFEVTDCDGQIRIVGQVACKLWLNPRVTISKASEAVTQDIMRSLVTRLEMHWDSLTEDEGSSEDVNSIHEPPRRVLVSLPHSKITLSDYLFPGEGPQDAVVSVQEMLDITVHNKNDIQDIEGQADLTEYYTEQLDSDSDENLPKLPTDTSKFMYISGAVVALLVLIISLLVHFLKE